MERSGENKVDYVCHICAKSYTSKFNFDYHVAHHSDERPWQCEYCSNAYKTKSDLNQHKKSHERELNLKFTCKFCNLLYDNSTALNVHMRIHRNVSKWCEVCCKDFTNLRSHQQIVHEKIKPYSCDLCCKKFGKFSGCQRHLLAVHMNIREFACNTCHKAFKEKCALTKHMKHHLKLDERIHRKIYTRKIKSIVYDNESDDEELLTEKEFFKCQLCSRVFLSLDKLIQHENENHIGLKFNCDFCNRNFSSKLKISRHIIKVHILNQSGKITARVKQFRCGLCKQILSSKSGLMRHKKYIHSNIYEFLCHQCSMPYRDRSALEKHLQRFHKIELSKPENGQTFDCPVCDRRFATHLALSGHEEKCRLKQQELYNRELDKQALLDGGTYQKHRKVSVESEYDATSTKLLDYIKSEPEEIILDELAMPYYPSIEDSEEISVSVKQEAMDSSLVTAFDFENVTIKEEFDPIENFDIQSLTVKQEGETIDLADSLAETSGEMVTMKDFLPTEFDTNREDNDVRLEDLFNFDETEVIILRDPPQASEPPLKLMKLVTKIRCKLCPDMKFDIKADFLKHFNEFHITNIRHETLNPTKLLPAQSLNSHKEPTRSAANEKKDLFTKKFRCKVCLQLFNTQEDVLKHYSDKHVPTISTHDNDNKFHCSYCSSSFDNDVDLKYHFNSMHKKQEDSNSSDAGLREKERNGTLVSVYRRRKKTAMLEIIPKGDDMAESEESSEGEPENIDESLISDLFKGSTYDRFKKYCCNLCTEHFKDLPALRTHCVKVHRIKRFKCAYCNHSFNDRMRMRTHWNKKHTEMLYKFKKRIFPIPNEDIKCHLCSKTFCHSVSLTRHMSLLHNANRLVLCCTHCSSTFFDPRGLKKHIDRMHKGIPAEKKRQPRKTTVYVPCEICNFKLLGLRELNAHRWVVHYHVRPIRKKYFECLICSQIIKCRISARRHYSLIHENGKKMFRKCQDCVIEYRLYDDFKKHVDVQHQNGFICLTCGMNMQTAHRLVRHNLEHKAVPDELKVLMCDLCGFRAQQKKTIESHMVHHGAAKKIQHYACEFCGFHFTNYQGWHTHRKTHLPKPRVPCTYCGKCFSSDLEKRNHERIHTNECPYVCKVPNCGKKFISVGARSAHRRSHHDQNRSQCVKCLINFTSKQKLLRHELEIHPEFRRFVCRDCFKAFRTPANLERHIESCQHSTA